MEHTSVMEHGKEQGSESVEECGAEVGKELGKEDKSAVTDCFVSVLTAIESADTLPLSCISMSFCGVPSHRLSAATFSGFTSTCKPVSLRLLSLLLVFDLWHLKDRFFTFFTCNVFMILSFVCCNIFRSCESVLFRSVF